MDNNGKNLSAGLPPNHPDYVPFPTNLAEAEVLIQELYKPNPPQRIALIQEIIQTVQKGPYGWELANALLESENETSRFFGALTTTIKLNLDSKSLSPENSKALLDKLVGCLISWVKRPGSDLSVRKLCSTLVVYFIKFESWRLCIRHLICSLSAGRPIEQEMLDGNNTVDIRNVLCTQSLENIRVLLWFSTTLVDEMARIDWVTVEVQECHERMLSNAGDAVELLKLGIENRSTPDVIRKECITCYSSWVMYSHRAFVNAQSLAQIIIDPLKVLIRPAMACLEQDPYPAAAELFIDILQNFSTFLSMDDLAQLFNLLNTSPWAKKYHLQLLEGDFDDEPMQFGYLAIALGSTLTPQLARNCKTNNALLTVLTDFLACKGYAVDEDKIFVAALEFWVDFVDYVSDWHDDDDDRSWIADAKVPIVEAIMRCLRKIQFPPPEVWTTWDSSDQTSFHDARRDFADLVLSSYSVAGNALLTQLANLAMQSLANGAWAELEASLFCLENLSDCNLDEQGQDGPEWSAIVESIVSSQLFDVLTNPQISIPAQVRQTAVKFVSMLAEHFERYPQFLTRTLNFLFKMMEFSTSARKAAQSIQKLCSACRLSLLPELGAFILHCSNLCQIPAVDAVVKEKMLGSIASIIQALPTDEAKITPLEQLLQITRQDVMACENAASKGDAIAAEAAGTSALRSLLSIAKGLQVPADVPIDLEKETVGPSIWIDGVGVPVQTQITTQISSVTGILKGSSDVIDIACQIYRTGFKEREPGPFVFSPVTVTVFIVGGSLETPRTDVLVSTAVSFVNSFRGPESIGGYGSTILTWLLGILKTSTDVDVAACGIQYFNALLPNSTDVLLTSQPQGSTEFIFEFTINALRGEEPIPRAAACEFWTKFLALERTAPPQFKESIIFATHYFGPKLAEALVYQIAGHAPRSALDIIAKPLKALAVNQVKSRQWLQHALFKETFENEVNNVVTEQDKRALLQKVLNLRGSRETTQAVTSFWIICRRLTS